MVAPKEALVVGEVYHANWLRRTPVVTLVAIEGNGKPLARVIPFTKYGQHEGQTVEAILLNPKRLKPLKPGEEVHIP